MPRLLGLSDSVIPTLIAQEEKRQQETVNLIASENYVSAAVRDVTGSCLTNKYAEGYPGKRYYAGCGTIDAIESIAIERCKQLFGVEYVNVQPHAGSQANMAVYYGVLKPGDTILGMNLLAGGHLTHGHSVNISGGLYKSVQYGVHPETHYLDYDEIAKLALHVRPKLIVCGASAYSRIIDFKRFKEIADSVGALLMADIAHIAGLVAAGVHPSPIGHADFITSTTHKTLRGPRGGLIMARAEYGHIIDRAIMPGTQGGPFLHVIGAKAIAFHEALQPSFIDYQKQVCSNARALCDALVSLGYSIVSGGTDNHLFVVDVRSKKINGLVAQVALEKAGIIVSRSCIPNDPEKPSITSGIRLGTPAITTRKFSETDMHELAQSIDELLSYPHDDSVIKAVRARNVKLCQKFPMDQM
jgi:glycine hydroxymethyltransferase